MSYRVVYASDVGFWLSCLVWFKIEESWDFESIDQIGVQFDIKEFELSIESGIPVWSFEHVSYSPICRK